MGLTMWAIIGGPPLFGCAGAGFFRGPQCHLSAEFCKNIGCMILLTSRQTKWKHNLLDTGNTISVRNKNPSKQPSKYNSSKKVKDILDIRELQTEAIWAESCGPWTFSERLATCWQREPPDVRRWCSPSDEQPAGAPSRSSCCTPETPELPLAPPTCWYVTKYRRKSRVLRHVMSLKLSAQSFAQFVWE